MNQDAINRDLSEKQDSSFQDKLKKRLLNYIGISTSTMSTYYDKWDAAERVYRAWRPADNESLDQKKKGRTAKIIVPISYAQQQAFLSFLLSAYTQRDYFYELQGNGPEDQSMVEGLQQDLQYQLNRNSWPLKLYHAGLYTTKLGLCVFKDSWVTERERVRTKRTVMQPSPRGLFDAMLGKPQQLNPITIEEVGEVISYEGNRLEVVSPYNFFPDPNIPVASFQEGEFVGHEAEKSMSSVKALEGDLYYGTGKIASKLDSSFWNTRTRRRGISQNDTAVNSFIGLGSLDGKHEVTNCIVSEFIFRAVPSELSKDFGIDCGKETTQEMFIATIANEQKIIRFERYNYLHGQFGFAVGEYSPDHSSFLNPGLSETIQELQEIISWLFYSHITSVERVIRSRFVANDKVMKEDITSGADIIRISNAGRVGDALQQLNVTDVTQQNVTDVNLVHSIIQLVTGINENASGQFAKGRRSATEAANVFSASSARLKMHAQLLYTQCYDPLGRLMLANTRQLRTKDVYDAILGKNSAKYPFEQVILTPASQVVGGYDFIPYDPQLPSDRENKAILLKEVFSMLVQNPATIQLLNKNPLKLLNHIAELLGIRNLEDFDMNPENNLPQGAQAQDLGGASQGPTVVSDQEALEAMDQGGSPVSLDMGGLLNES